MGLRLHLAFSVLLLAPLVVLLLGDRRMFRRESAELARLTRQDWRWLTALHGHLIGLRYTTEGVVRYNAGQKLNTRGVLLSLVGLILTGVLLWVHAPASLLPALRWAHDALTMTLGLLVACTSRWVPEAMADGTSESGVRGRLEHQGHP